MCACPTHPPPRRHTFASKWLVVEALTHCSWPGSGVRCFQRLEFLGDAVLDALVTTHFYTAFRREGRGLPAPQGPAGQAPGWLPCL